MRNETEMYQLILDLAKADPGILAVYLNGSRTNSNVPKDIFQDYDVVYVVRETKRYIEDKAWIQNFGTILYMQYPDENSNYPSDKENRYGWLMQFADGNRLDLHVETLSYARAHIGDDRLCKILLDKEQLLPAIEPATDADYYVKKPTEEQFLACANEFWWCSNNLAKGLWREEILYVQDMANFIVRKELERMLSWKVGMEHDFAVSVGKSAKYIGRWLQKEVYRQYLDTFFGSSCEDAWRAVLVMCDLFAQTAVTVAQALGYHYDTKEGEAARGFLEHVRTLPKDAEEIYPSCMAER